MKALLSCTVGGPQSLVLRDVEPPVPRGGEVRIAVRACAINYPDVLMIEDKHQNRHRRPFAPGLEVAGVVESVAADVTHFVPGQRVMASMDCGGLAEFAVTTATKCIAIPDSMPFDVAASFQVTYGTAYHALVDRAALMPTETLLVLGASGGVGIAALEIGRTLGANVVAAVSSVEKANTARGHGAEGIVVYPLEEQAPKEMAMKFKAACPGGADVIFDGVGGFYTEPALRTIAWGGRHLVIGFPAGIPKVPINLALIKACSIIGVFWGAWVERSPDQHQKNMATLLEWHAQGAIRPWISARYPLSEGGHAIQQLAGRKARGKVVVII